jgi:hypothetical protein
MDIHRILTYNRTPTRRLRFSSTIEIPETPRVPIPESQISTQRWDSQNGPTPPRTRQGPATSRSPAPKNLLFFQLLRKYIDTSIASATVPLLNNKASS